jgi:hypothetical protein
MEKIDKPHFASGDVVPEFAAKRISMRHAETYLTICDCCPFGYRRRTPQFGQVKSKATVSLDVSVIALSATGSRKLQPVFVPPSAIRRTALRKTSISSNVL